MLLVAKSVPDNDLKSLNETDMATNNIILSKLAT